MALTIICQILPDPLTIHVPEPRPVRVVSGLYLAGGCQEVRLLQKGLQVPAAIGRRKDNVQHNKLGAKESGTGLVSLS